MRILKTFFALFLLALAISATSCDTPKHIAKKRAKLTAAFDKLKSKADADADLTTVPTERCTTWYVPKVETKTITKYLPGKPIKTTEVQYITVDCDSVVKATPKAKDRIVKVLVPTYLQVDTNAITTEIDRENVAALALKDSVIAKKDKALANAQDKQGILQTKATNRLHSALWGWGLFILLIAGIISYNMLKSQYAKKAEAVKNLL